MADNNAIQPITRDQLAKFLPDNDTIRRFEKLFQLVGTTTPANIDVIFRLIDEVTISAGTGNAAANSANASLDAIAQALAVLSSAPPQQPQTQPDNLQPPIQSGNGPDDLSPPIQVGTLGQQQADRVRITGGSIDGTVIGATTSAAATVSTLTSAGTVVVGALLNLTSAGAGQIQFPATQNPSANANTLDDYEEGTWTPVLTFTTPGDLNVVYGTRTGTYTKVGNSARVDCNLVTTTWTWTTSSGTLAVTGLPFAAGTVAAAAIGNLTAQPGANLQPFAQVIGVGVQFLAVNVTTSAVANIVPAALPSGAQRTVVLGAVYGT